MTGSLQILTILFRVIFSFLAALYNKSIFTSVIKALKNKISLHWINDGQGQLGRYSGSLRARLFGDRIAVEARFPVPSRPAFWFTLPHVQSVLGFFAGLKRPGREVDDWPLSSIEVKIEWSCTSLPQTGKFYVLLYRITQGHVTVGV
jgi:hypothetical protein